jgi:hypothetical protein
MTYVSYILQHILSTNEEKIKAIPVTGRGELWSCEMSRIPHYLRNRLTDGGEVVSLTQRSHPTHQKHISASGAHFC